MPAASPSSSVRASAPPEVREAPRGGAAALCDERERMGWSLGERRCHATPRRAFGRLIHIVATGRSARGVPGDPRIATRPRHPPARRVPVAPALESRDQQPLFALSRSSYAPRSPPPTRDSRQRGMLWAARPASGDGASGSRAVRAFSPRAVRAVSPHAVSARRSRRLRHLSARRLAYQRFSWGFR